MVQRSFSIHRNTTVEEFYKYSANRSTTLGYYYLNTFDNLMASGMTLFELTVVNNWFILMNAYAFTVGLWSRAFFMTFYLVTMIVLTIVVSSFLEAFRFRIQYKRSTSKRDGTGSLFHFFFRSADIFNHVFILCDRGKNAARRSWTEVGRVAGDCPRLSTFGTFAFEFGRRRKFLLKTIN